jgi:hypothetical protein
MIEISRRDEVYPPLMSRDFHSPARGLLGNLGMLFVPTGVGITQQMDLVINRGLALAIVLVRLHHADPRRPRLDIPDRQAMASDCRLAHCIK